MKKGIFSVLLNVILGVIIVLAVVVTVVSLATQEDGVPKVLGYVPLSIQTGSMEDTIMIGDLIITHAYEDQKLEEGQIISFFTIEQEQRIIMTHRIIEVNEVGQMLSYTTQGDNNEIPDKIEVAPGDIISVYEGTRLPMVGSALDLLGSQYGFLFLIIIPLFGFFLYQLYNFIVLVIEMKKEQTN